MTQYYSLLKTTLEEHDILNWSCQMYNMGESGMPLDHKPLKVIAHKGTKKISCRTLQNKVQITILACAYASIQSGVRGKYLTHFMECQTKGREKLNRKWKLKKENLRRYREPNKRKLQGEKKVELQQKQAAEREKHTRSGKQQVCAACNGLQSAEISSNECAACLGAFNGG